MKKNNNPDVVIIGGGVIGASVAYYLSKEDLSIVLLEKDRLASGSSGACSGKVWLGTKKAGLHLRLALASLELLKGLLQEMSYTVECDEGGEMLLIEKEQDLQFMEDFVENQTQAGVDIRILNKDETLDMQPALARNSVVGATYSPLGITIDPMDLLFGLMEEAKRLGADIRRNTTVEEIGISSSIVKSVRTNQGEIHTKCIVNAAGVGAPQIGKMLGLEIPIVPLRGQILITEAVEPLVRVATTEGKYLIVKRDPEMLEKTTSSGVTLGISQTPRGNIHIGASKEFVGHNTETLPEAMAVLAQRAITFFPELSGVNVIRSFAGLRPYTPDGVPILGRVQGIEGFIMAAGHGGDGVALAPITGKLIAEIITKGEPSICIDKLSLARFGVTS